MFKLFSKKSRTTTQVTTHEPEFLNEYIVDIGRSTVCVYARTESEAKQEVIKSLQDNTPYYDSKRLRTHSLDEARITPRGDIKVYFNRVTRMKNPAY